MISILWYHIPLRTGKHINGTWWEFYRADMFSIKSEFKELKRQRRELGDSCFNVALQIISNIFFLHVPMFVLNAAAGTCSAADCYFDVSGGANAAVECSLSDKDCTAVGHFISNNAGFRGRALIARHPREIARLFSTPALCAFRQSYRWLRGSTFWPGSFGVQYHCSGSSGFESFGLNSLSKYFGFNWTALPLRSRERPSKPVSLILMLFLTSDVREGDVPCHFYLAGYTIRFEIDALAPRKS